MISKKATSSSVHLQNSNENSLLQVTSLEDKGWAMVPDGVIAKGAFGWAGKVRQQDGRLCVLKQMFSTRTDEAVLREVRLLQRCRHFNIVSYVDAFIDRNGRLNIIMEACEGGTLADKIGTHPEEETLWCYLIQIFQGLKYLHDLRILHRDIKPANILLTADNNIKIADMGLGRYLGDVEYAYTNCGTPLYQAPEMCTGDQPKYNSACDVWAVGCTMYELATGDHPFFAPSIMGILEKVQKLTPPSLSPQFSAAFDFVVLQLLCKDPVKRPTATDVLTFEPIRERIQWALLLRWEKDVVDGLAASAGRSLNGP